MNQRNLFVAVKYRILNRPPMHASHAADNPPLQPRDAVAPSYNSVVSEQPRTQWALENVPLPPKYSEKEAGLQTGLTLDCSDLKNNVPPAQFQDPQEPDVITPEEKMTKKECCLTFSGCCCLCCAEMGIRATIYACVVGLMHCCMACMS